MNQERLCSHCQQLISNQSYSVPLGYTRVSRVYNHTLYHCGACGAYFGHIHVPHRWQLMLAPLKRYDTQHTVGPDDRRTIRHPSSLSTPGII